MQIYKANKSNKGCACSLSFNSKDGVLFIQLIKQVSYNEERHIGSFSGGEKITIKSSITEIGNILDVLTRNVDYSTVHQSPNASTQIWFAPYNVEVNGVKEQRGYGLRISQKTKDGQELKFLMPFNFGEAATLRVYLNFVLNHIFAAEYAESKRKYQEKVAEFESNAKVANKAKVPKPSVETPEQEDI